MIISELIKYGAGLFDVKYADIVGEDRHRKFIRPRFAVILALEKRGHSSPKIGSWVNRCHDSVNHAIRTGEKFYASEPEFRFKVNAIATAKLKDGKVVAPHDVVEYVARYTGRSAGEVLASPFTEPHRRVFDTAIHLLVNQGYSYAEISKVVERDWQVVRRADIGYVNKWMDDKVASAMLTHCWDRFFPDELEEAAE